MASTAAEHCDPVGLPLPLTPEDGSRADWYAVLARLLLHAPDAGLLQQIATSGHPAEGHASAFLTGSALDLTWQRLAAASGAMDETAASTEFSRLFIDVGVPQVDPYGSRYVAGFMMEKPLAQLRSDLLEFGLARKPGSGELEDHLGVLCETMRVLITGEATGRQASLAHQRQFFQRHLAPWWQRCLDDIRNAEGANYYRCVADLAEAFLEVEEQAFDMLGLNEQEMKNFSEAAGENP